MTCRSESSPSGLAALAALLLLLGACRGEPEAASSPDTPSPVTPAPEPSFSAAPAEVELAAGSEEVRTLEEGEVHAYRVHLEAEEYLHLAVDQQGLDVVLTLSDPQGETLLRVDTPPGAWGPEEIFWLAQAPGPHRLEVRALSQEATGAYGIRVRQLRRAREEDRRRAAAARSYEAGERLRREGGPQALPRAIRHYEEALAVWQELGDQTRQAAALYRLGLVHMGGERRQALASFEGARALYEATGKPRMEASALHRIGQQHYALGDVERARQRYEEALRHRIELGDPRGEANSSNNLGLANAILGEFQRALTLYDRALVLWRELGNRSEEGRVLHNRGKCYVYLGQFRQALDDLSQALEIRQELGDRNGQAVTLTGIGLVHEAQARYPDALDVLQRALQLRIEGGSRPGQAVTLSIMGRVHAALQQESRALEAFAQAREIFRELDDSRRGALVLYDTGSFLLALGRPEEALEHLRQALPVLAETGGQTEVDALGTIALAERRRGDLEAARDFIEQALDKNEALRVKPASHALRSSFFALRQNLYDFYVDLLMELHRRHPAAGHDAAAFAVSERSRARSQLEALIEGGADVRRGADPALLRRERELEKRINDKENLRLRLLDETLAAEQIANVERELRALLREYQQVRGQIRVSSPVYAALTQPSPLDAGQVQRQVLDSDTLLLQYELEEERSYLWAVTREKISSFELPGRARLERSARRAYELLTVSNRRESRLPTERALAEASAMLLRPAADLLGDKRLLVVAEGALQYVPFAALPAPAAAEHEKGDQEPAAPLVAAHEIVYMPSASTLAELRRQLARRPLAPGLVAVVADPVFQSHDPRFRSASGAGPGATARGGDVTDLRRFERLVFSEREAAAILEMVPAEKRFQALGFAANREVVTGGDLGRYQIVHFATHGYVDAAHPELSRLVLSLRDEANRPRDGFLFAHEIYNLELPAELVVLSACRTALGKEVPGEGLLGLTQGFMYAGAARVLVSLWPVNDQATAELMARFYRHLLRKGLPPAAALRQAQLAIRRETRWQAPYFWAGFMLQGEWWEESATPLNKIRREGI